MAQTGVVLFVYNRPEHTRRVLDGLRQNDIDKLHVFADGPESTDEIGPIESVRDLVHSIDWCETDIIEREENWGLAENTVDGLNRMFTEYDRVVMLEDDDVPSPDFMDYMEACLDKYEDEDRVMSVTGFSIPIELPDDYQYDVFFTHRETSWGWGSWKSAWDHYERKPDEMRRQIAENENEVREILEIAGYDLFSNLEKQLEGNSDSWSIWWALAIAEQEGICVNPVESRIKQIGHDGSGVHCSSKEKFDVEVGDDPTSQNLNYPPTTTVNEEINRRFKEYIVSNGGVRGRMKRVAYRILDVVVPET
jgi:hypothetical protein